MDLREQVIRMTERASDSLFRIARAVPEDKLNWKPMDNGRTVLDQLQECAYTPLFFAGVIEPSLALSQAPEAIEERAQIRATWTVDECESQIKSNNQTYFEILRKIPDEEMNKEIDLPWGEKATLGDAMGFQYWNLIYHEGQINYIQTLYGDTEHH